MNLYSNYPYFDKPVKIVAHRGDSKFFPENSMIAFESAVELGVDVIETDVHISSDGVIFVWHDDDTFQLDGSKVPVSNRSWDELKQLDLGFLYIDKEGKRPFSSKGISLTTFKDVLRAFPNTRFNVDLKDKKAELVTGFFSLLEEENAFNRVVVASFHEENLKLIRTMSDKVATSYGKGEVLLRVLLDKVKLFRLCSNFLPRHPVMQVPVASGLIRVVTKRFIKILHKRGIKIQVWTINDEFQMRNLLKMGVDGIMTDDPRLLISTLKRKV
ncbi:MAG: glycerophosphodiester phosphodiesterase [Spirochaetales bacterium]|nr:glycerophosphodiester phosphodiesterase [Spirochaetales bacterium]